MQFAAHLLWWAKTATRKGTAIDTSRLPPGASSSRPPRHLRDVSSDASTTGRITVDPAAVARNWTRLAAMTAAECGGVVKANAYGCGVAAIAPALAAAGCRTFFTATAREGLELRAILPEARIFVMNGVFDDARLVREARLIPFVASLEALAEWPADAPFALNIDTGMNRLGLTVAEALGVSAAPVLLASHFGSADTPGHPQNASQEAAFATVRAAFPHTPASFANSAAMLTRPATHHDLVRPGIALYGGTASEAAPALETVMRLEAQVILVRQPKAGETVGYGASQTLTRDSRIAVAALGYADGYPRIAGGSDSAPGAPVFVNGEPTRLVGRVSMDLIAIDVTDIPCRRGDFIELIGPNVPLDAVARRCHTIGYELLTSLSRRAERHYGPL